MGVGVCVRGRKKEIGGCCCGFLFGEEGDGVEKRWVKSKNGKGMGRGFASV